MCKATDKCRQCSACLIPEKIQEVYQQPLVEILTNTQVVGVEGKRAASRSGCKGSKPSIQPFAMPVESALRSVPKVQSIASIPGRRHIESTRKKCVAFAGEDCDLCARACPTGAINFQRPVVNLDASVELVVAATGHQPFDARRKYRLGYGRFPRVITGLELEEALNEIEGTDIFGDGRKPLDVAFIQCIGSRDVQEGGRILLSGMLQVRSSLGRTHASPRAGDSGNLLLHGHPNWGKGFAEVYQECTR